MFISKRVTGFLTVIEAGSFSRAAELLYVSAPALIQQINLLEDEIGVPLLIRIKRGVQPTAAGKVFYEAMKTVSASTADAVEKTIAEGMNQKREIRLLYDQSLPHKLINLLAQQYVLENTHEISTIAILPDQIKLQLTQHNADCVLLPIGAHIRNAGLETKVLFEKRPFISIPSEWHLSQKAFIHARDLDGLEVVLPGEGKFDSSDVFRQELLANCSHPCITTIDGFLEADRYCSTHRACRLCFHRVYDPSAVILELDTQAKYGVCLSYPPEKEIRWRLSGLIKIIHNFANKADGFIADSYR